MNPEDLDLIIFRKSLEDALTGYTTLNRGLSFQEFLDLKLTPENPFINIIKIR